ncbi:hypothetical protein AB6A40_008318 [Gnathostoma spinigerum]|uniref:CWH43-like N-terminal domain-containing protein n=1 Tax=Gnathostoma spinigerum TaxID=75299 RepID=A0ABD6ETV6_9BILA
MALSKVWIIPLTTFVLSILAFLVSYTIAVLNNHVQAVWPYISDSGTLPPESCIFAQLLNISALFLAITSYLRHRQIVEFYWHHFKQEGYWRPISLTMLWLGYISSFGVSMVANFQVRSPYFKESAKKWLKATYYREKPPGSPLYWSVHGIHLWTGVHLGADHVQLCDEPQNGKTYYFTLPTYSQHCLHAFLRFK